MALLESQIKAQVATAFKGRLLKGTLRRIASTSLDAAGNEEPGTATTYTFDGIRENLDAAYAAKAGIQSTDVSILIIAGSISVTPKQDDEIKIRNQWHKVRRILKIDPANATYLLLCYEITDPTV